MLIVKIKLLGITDFLKFHNMDAFLQEYQRIKEHEYKNRENFIAHLKMYSSMLNHVNMYFLLKGNSYIYKNSFPKLINKISEISKENKRLVTNQNKQEILFSLFTKVFNKFYTDQIMISSFNYIDILMRLSQIIEANKRDFETLNMLLAQTYLDEETYMNLCKFYKQNVYSKEKKNKNYDFKILSLKEILLIRNNIKFEDLLLEQQNIYPTFSMCFTLVMQFKVFKYLKYIK